MEINDIIKEFFSNIRCTQCHNFFEEEAISLIRHENNYTVVRVTCSKCGKNIGMALLGIDKESMKNSVKCLNEEDERTEIPVEIASNSEPITYDDVIDAHNFFYSLGNDWSKYLPEADK